MCDLPWSRSRSDNHARVRVGNEIVARCATRRVSMIRLQKRQLGKRRVQWMREQALPANNLLYYVIILSYLVTYQPSATTRPNAKPSSSLRIDPVFRFNSIACTTDICVTGSPTTIVFGHHLEIDCSSCLSADTRNLSRHHVPLFYWL